MTRPPRKLSPTEAATPRPSPETELAAKTKATARRRTSGAKPTEGSLLPDLSLLPAAGFRSHGLWYWAGLAFMLMEGTGFALAGASYLYVMNGNSQWPLNSDAPSLVWGTAQTLLLLGSLIPNMFVSRAARSRDVASTRFWALVMTGAGVLSLIVRAVEFPHLNTRWDFDAYGSVVWALMLLHTTHIVTDFVDTALLTVFLHTHPVDDERLSDTDDNAAYWAFVVLTWLPLYLLVYWAPRWAP